LVHASESGRESDRREAPSANLIARIAHPLLIVRFAVGARFEMQSELSRNGAIDIVK